MKVTQKAARWAVQGFAILSAAVLLTLPQSGTANAASYPERPIELIVPWGPGGGADQLARLISKLMEPEIGQSIPVVNVPEYTEETVAEGAFALMIALAKRLPEISGAMERNGWA